MRKRLKYLSVKLGESENLLISIYCKEKKKIPAFHTIILENFINLEVLVHKNYSLAMTPDFNYGCISLTLFLYVPWHGITSMH